MKASKSMERAQGCFVATVVYGNANSPQVEKLSNYKDNVMAQNLLGRGLIKLYYSGFGEIIAYFIRDKIPRAIPIIKRSLDLIVANLT